MGFPRIENRERGEGCRACGAFQPEVIVPVFGDPDTARVCWLCAHAMSAHEVELEHAMAHRCSCKAETIYPPDVRAKHAPPIAEYTEAKARWDDMKRDAAKTIALIEKRGDPEARKELELAEGTVVTHVSRAKAKQTQARIAASFRWKEHPHYLEQCQKERDLIREAVAREGSVVKAAVALGHHRTTLIYRIRQLDKILASASHQDKPE